MNYIVVKRIRVEAPTLEEAIQKHDKGQTISLTATEDVQQRPNTHPAVSASRPQSIRNPRP